MFLISSAAFWFMSSFSIAFAAETCPAPTEAERIKIFLNISFCSSPSGTRHLIW